MRAFTVAALALALASSGCGREDLSDEGFVSGLRLLGAQAEPPEAAPGDSVMLTAWPVDTRGGSISVAWSVCFLPSDGLANDGCTAGNAGVAPLGNGTTLAIAVPPVTAAMLGPPDATGGYYLPILMHVTSNGDSVDGVYRLRMLGSDPTPNANPSFDSITGLNLHNLPTAVRVNEVLPMVAVYTGDSRQEYAIPPDLNKKVPEMLITQWFATAGTFPQAPVGGTALQTLTLDRALPAPGGTIDLWIVGHDDRGGSTMLHSTLTLQ